MSSADHARTDGTDDERAARDRIEFYETAEGIVFYDVYDPLAWVKTTDSLPLPDQV